MKEEWRAVVGYKGLYEVSSLGRVRSLDRETIRTWKGAPYIARRKGQICKPDGWGYYFRIYLYRGKERRRYCVHDLVAAAFIGPKPTGYHTCHNDGNERHNAKDNLRYDTPSGNQADRVKHGTDMRGEKHPMKKISEADARWIIANAGIMRIVRMAERLGVSACCVGDVVHGRTWKHLEASL